MRTITKGKEPASLTAHRKMSYSYYYNYKETDELRDALVKEQRGLCCYCMERISSDQGKVKIEHWQCQSQYPDRQLDYRNLLAACPGGEGEQSSHQHCDTRKGDKDLKWNPADPAHRIETRLQYGADGSIRSNDPDPTFDTQLCQVLNLNLAKLKNNRKGVLDVILKWWQDEKAKIKGPVPRSRFEQKRDQWAGGAGALKPYCQVVIWWLDQRLKRMPA